ncbi:hypothetical protein AUR64_17800 [Haloprofundus marisrubri]|uniref:DUF447 family protein n=1 Tax=Haloprofundus marisrubri TaxID=1514971 RepID=A0A0W1R574_9EURY|nr:DUF447 domain-containing protein [Haloprofundus marisrubri]KTG08531.1 hypothetical protein AUR64_17800 [Haloprofundus marisrubri]
MSDGERGDGSDSGTDTEWPVELRGVSETVVTTLGPNDLWNVAALGVHAPADSDSPATATTWGNTRTRRNFHRQSEGVVQFVTDPRTFVDAAVTIREEKEPVLDSADAWVRVGATCLDSEPRNGTTVEHWELHPVEAEVIETGVRTINRGFYAVVDATVAASRLDVPAYDTETLLARLDYFAETVEKCGGAAEREAFERLSAETGWRERRDG